MDTKIAMFSINYTREFASYTEGIMENIVFTIS